MIYKSVKTFIQPRVSALIAAHNHWEPVVAKFVIGNVPKRCAPTAEGTKTNSRILHSSHVCGHIYGVLVWIGKIGFGIKLNGCLCIFRRSPPHVWSVAHLGID